MQEQIQNLKQSELTQVLADGFAELYHKRPQFPVTYLAAYLKQYSQTKVLKNTLLTDRISKNKALSEEIKKKSESEQKFKQEQTKRSQAEKEQINNYLKKIESTQYHEDILNQFCTWVEDTYMLTGAYLGELKLRKKVVNLDEEDSEQAHYDAQAEKLIYFEAYSRSHADLLKDKTLPPDSVLGKLLTADGGSGEQQQAQQGEQKIEAGPKDEIYYPSVVDRNQLTFFRFPRLGSFYGIGLKIKSYISEKLLEPNTTKIQTYFKSLQDYEREREERQAKFKQAYEEKAGSGAEEQELEQMEKQYENEEKNFPKPEYPELQFIERQIVFGCDTLGQDRQISKQDRVKIKGHLQFLKKMWEVRQIQALKTDIQRHLKLGDKLEGPATEVLTKLIQDQDKELPSNQEVQKYKDNQKLMQLELDTLRLQKMRQYFSDEKYIPFIEEILQAKILKYKEVLKYWLLFSSFKKTDINIEGTNVLDLRKAKKLITENVFADRLNDYNPRGSKPDVTVLGYAKWQRMVQNLQKIDINAVAAFNIYLAFLLRALILIGKIRQADRLKRIDIMLQERKSRRERIKQNQAKQRAHDEKLETAKAEAAEKQEEFDEETWEAQYMQAEENQLAEVGPTIPDEIDLDLQNGEQIFPEPEEEQPPAEQEPENPPE